VPGRAPGPPRDRSKGRLLRLYEALLGHFGRQHWWPGRTPYEVAVGAVLTQHTAWPNAARAIEALRARGLLTPARVAALDASDLAGVIRPAGTPRVKARRIQALTGWLVESMGGSFSRLRTAPLAPLRRRPNRRRPARPYGIYRIFPVPLRGVSRTQPSRGE